MLWPQTLKAHKMKSWVGGWIGALLLYIGTPAPIIGDKLAKIRETNIYKKFKIPLS
jgi:hypothetical protein